jgi:hypothetical protein
MVFVSQCEWKLHGLRKLNITATPGQAHAYPKGEEAGMRYTRTLEVDGTLISLLRHYNKSAAILNEFIQYKER